MICEICGWLVPHQVPPFACAVCCAQGETTTHHKPSQSLTKHPQSIHKFPQAHKAPQTTPHPTKLPQSPHKAPTKAPTNHHKPQYHPTSSTWYGLTTSFNTIFSTNMYTHKTPYPHPIPPQNTPHPSSQYHLYYLTYFYYITVFMKKKDDLPSSKPSKAKVGYEFPMSPSSAFS